MADDFRLNKRMTDLGLCSRREADVLIDKGLVYVDGTKAHHPGQRVTIDQHVRVDDQAEQASKFTVLINKPVGYVSGTPEPDYTSAHDLIRMHNYYGRAPGHFKMSDLSESDKYLAPAGRLDIDSEGLLIMTNDGRVAKAIIAPDSNIEKEYLVRFYGQITPQKLDLLCHGLRLDDRYLKPAKVKQINDEQLQFVLKEGRKRQIRRMCEQVDIEIEKLQRVRIGRLRLSTLPLGQWRLFDEHDTI